MNRDTLTAWTQVGFWVSFGALVMVAMDGNRLAGIILGVTSVGLLALWQELAK